MTSLQETLGNKFPFMRPDFLMIAKDKSHWLSSFLLAAGFHLLLFFGGGLALMKSPEFGMQGSAASMEIYMVAALPQQKEAAKVFKEPEEQVLDIIEVKGEMEVYQPKEIKSEAKKDSTPDALKSEKGKDSKKSEAKGDGSSPTPGKSSTSFFSQGSSATQGKKGKYQNPPPRYPAIAEEKGWEGVVMLNALIQKEGEPAEVLIEKSSGYKILDDAALETVKKWKFTAGQIAGQPVASWIKIPIRFQLESKRK